MKKILILMSILALYAWAKPYTDMLGRVVDIKKNQTFVFIGPGALRLGVYLGLKNRVIGIERIEQMKRKINIQSPYRMYLGEKFTHSRPLIGNGGPGKMPNLEALVNVNPDVIFTSFIKKDQIEIIRQKTGIPVVALSYGSSYGGKGNKNLDEIKNSLYLISQIAHVEERAKEIIDFIEFQEKKLSKIKPSKKSLYVGGVAYKGIQPITSTEVDYPPFVLLGQKNCVFENSTIKGHQFIDFEALLKANPEVIFTDMQSHDKITQDYKKNKPMYETLQAYKNMDVKEVLGFNNYSTNVENLLVIAWQIATYLGESIDINKKAEDIYEVFYPKNGKVLLHKLEYNLGNV
ncbi:ABC transporter substrate-binding protein [Sulfurospirillum arcachonense]|uniref:ABC transporter substrate-binding protein n=1 Tax=Sulfurospirillum arcachonense TaxID=57666 RepID=UPI00046A0152|nr:ABC transporter substrate-binding protein [Sulfurospirillum arcachonense]